VKGQGRKPVPELAIAVPSGGSKNRCAAITDDQKKNSQAIDGRSGVSPNARSSCWPSLTIAAITDDRRKKPVLVFGDRRTLKR
jgi:hypothetical protein